jgi:hypothetical protein
MSCHLPGDAIDCLSCTWTIVATECVSYYDCRRPKSDTRAQGRRLLGACRGGISARDVTALSKPA